jgi:methyltransferase
VSAPAAGAPIGWLAAFLAFLIVQRISELVLSARNARRMRARGAREYGREHYPWLVVLHTLFPIALAVEVLLLGARPGAWAALWLTVWVIAQVLRYSAILALGEHWNTRVLAVPGGALVNRGIYRRLRHPNYVAVVLELLSSPLFFGAWRTAIVFSLANLALLRFRIRCEEHALREASATDAERHRTRVNRNPHLFRRLP